MQHVCGRGDLSTVFSWGNLMERYHLEAEVEVDGQIMLKYSRNRLERVECIRLTKNRGRWRAVLNAVMNFQFT
jgi:hypothetical protein